MIFTYSEYVNMDDFVISNLHEARNEWCSRLVSVFTPLVEQGLRSIFDEAWKMCVDTDEMNKYLMTFQNLLSRIPKWNSVIVEDERKRIIERSGCNYLEDLITCVHIIQLKALTCVRVGQKQKAIDIDVPKLSNFIHKVYIHCARRIYSNVYLFERNVGSLQHQKNARELEVIVQECIMTTIRDSIPTESIIRAYMDDAVEEDEEVVIEEVAPPPAPEPIEHSIPTPVIPPVIPPEPPVNTMTGGMEPAPIVEAFESPAETSNEIIKMPEPLIIPPVSTPVLEPPPVPSAEQSAETISFNNTDTVLTETDHITQIEAPKSIEHLEEINTARELERRMDDDEQLTIHDEDIHLTDFEDMTKPAVEPVRHDEDISALLGEIEEL